MSVQTLYTAATGMEALQSKLDVIAHNLANVNTVGFKKNRANFEDLFYRQEILPGAEDAGGGQTATGTAVGLGTRVSSVQTDFKQGAYQHTENPLDVLIEGDGFFQLQDPTGTTVYSRAGNFSINSNGNLVQGSASVGRLVQPTINVPQDAIRVEVTADGTVNAYTQGQPTPQEVGTLQLATFINPEGLVKLGENMFQESSASGTATIGDPGQDGLGVLRSGFLEASNVEPVAELIDLITTQRSFELNSQAVQAGDEVLQLISNLRRF